VTKGLLKAAMQATVFVEAVVKPLLVSIYQIKLQILAKRRKGMKKEVLIDCLFHLAAIHNAHPPFSRDTHILYGLDVCHIRTLIAQNNAQLIVVSDEDFGNVPTITS
jgi:hypothetical protein